jgi:hypothetical protein
VDVNNKMTCEIELESLQVQIDLFKQLRHHLLFLMNRYHQQGEREPAKMIRDVFSDSSDSSCLYKD